MTEHDPPWSLIASYLAGESAAEERMAVEQWMAEHHDRRKLIAQLREAFEVIGTESAATFDLRAVERTVLSEIFLANQNEAASSPSVTDTHLPRRSSFAAGLSEHKFGTGVRTPRRLWSRAASVLVGAAAILVLWIGSSVLTERHATLEPGTTYATRKGQRADITLPDGSQVTLNVASRLQVPANFAQGNRTVQLTGEALLTVAHTDGTPFTVITGSTTARVLGTTFAVRHYPADTSTLVAVRNGKVAVQSNVLTAREQAEVFDGGRTHVERADSTVFEFANGMLTLDWMPLKDAIVELDRWYDVNIVLADPSLATRQVKASFASGAASDLASILSLMLHARVEHDGRTLTIYPQ